MKSYCYFYMSMMDSNKYFQLNQELKGMYVYKNYLNLFSPHYIYGIMREIEKFIKKNIDNNLYTRYNNN